MHICHGKALHDAIHIRHDPAPDANPFRNGIGVARKQMERMHASRCLFDSRTARISCLPRRICMPARRLRPSRRSARCCKTAKLNSATRQVPARAKCETPFASAIIAHGKRANRSEHVEISMKIIMSTSMKPSPQHHRFLPQVLPAFKALGTRSADRCLRSDDYI